MAQVAARRKWAYDRIEAVVLRVLDGEWPWDRGDRVADAVLAVTDGAQIAACLLMRHYFIDNFNAYGPRRYCCLCEVAEPGTLVRRRFVADSVARRWPLPGRAVG